jgi:hypothetical protein
MEKNEEFERKQWNYTGIFENQNNIFFGGEGTKKQGR